MGLEPTTFSLEGCEHRKQATPTQELTNTLPDACTNACTNGSDSVHDDGGGDFVGALAKLAEAERAAVLAHVKALAHLSPAKRAAILTLTATME